MSGVKAWSMSPAAVASRERRAHDRNLPAWPHKEDTCCAATRDRYNRLCLGYCGPNCERRP